MKKIVLVPFLLIVGCNTSQKTVSDSSNRMENVNPSIYAETITQEDLKTHLYTYASDEFEGRETGEPGQKKAVEYLKSHYEKLNVHAAKKDGDYFQKVPLEKANVPKGFLTINKSKFNVGEDIITFGATEDTYDQYVYVGYGIEEGHYSDYNKVDVKGKLVLIKAGEPIDANGNYLLSGTMEKSVWSNMSEAIKKKADLAKEKGAVAIMYYDEQNYSRFKGYFDYMQRNKSGKMELREDSSDTGLMLLSADATMALIDNIEKDHTPKSMESQIVFNISSGSEMIESENVVAFIKGTEKPEEYLVISSHLDHIGVTADGQINNGADDDGSGSVALLEIAEAFKKAKEAGHGPKRSIVFLHVTGEEKGLLGSRYYTDFDPIFPLEQTVADLNIDMIGRIDPKRTGDRNYIYLIGSDKLSTDLHNLSEAINEKYTQIELDYTYNDENDPNRFYYRSDHYNFAKNNIPIIFYFNGTHADYHKPGDTPDKINYDLLENRTRLVFHTAWEVANRDARVVVDKGEN